ncbi:ribose 5-phosphate isomerase A [Ferrimicrobium acidiphilum]|jgi:ribose 5-phosphate isomerase A|uniref:ribose 5-phosphate isomerase A n=1 Tax=Ferrimicrobium acidiphilum TaxID=121039 RepID=UPI0023F58C05|nr:ribose 5-phosphate isomerase A [Ferrimicrobium acidiphilum]MCL5054172.1 ribose 5-phosphate isomerase A [Gammaproteobacteria bacterium]
MTDNQLQREKELAAKTAADFVEAGMSVGLGTGTTVACLLPILAARRLSIRCVATSPQTEELARQLGMRVEPFTDVRSLDIAIDGADQIAPDGWLVKGGGAAHTREKLVAITAARFIVIADSSKPVDILNGPLPIELLAFGLGSTLRRLGNVTLRNLPPSPDGGIIGDYHGPLDEPRATATWLSGTPGLIEHGLFPPEMVSTAIIGRGEQVEVRNYPRS